MPWRPQLVWVWRLNQDLRTGREGGGGGKDCHPSGKSKMSTIFRLFVVVIAKENDIGEFVCRVEWGSGKIVIHPAILRCQK